MNSVEPVHRPRRATAIATRTSEAGVSPSVAAAITGRPLLCSQANLATFCSGTVGCFQHTVNQNLVARWFVVRLTPQYRQEMR